MNEEIIGKIKRLRLIKGLTQNCVADRLNITCSAYQKLESGKSHVWAKYLDKLMEVLEITPQEFFDENNKNPEHLGKVIENLKKLDSHSFASISCVIEILAKNSGS